MKRSQSSRTWLKEHFTDPYVIQAQKQGLRSRAAFKLLEIQEKDTIIKPGMTVVDLGAAPGGWSQVVLPLLKGQGQLIAFDILPMEVFSDKHFTFIQGDFHEEIALKALEMALQDKPIDLVISDMAPNTSGISTVDQIRSMLLCELALDFALQHLKGGGSFLVKSFQGQGSDAYLKLLRTHFAEVLVRKPKASRSRSSEIYLLAKNRKIR